MADILGTTPGGMSTLPLGGATGAPPDLAAPTNYNLDMGGADVPAPKPTRAETIESIRNEALRIQDTLNTMQGEQTVGNLIGLSTPDTEESYAPFDEEAARRAAQRNQMRLYQAEIDATNQVYDQLLNEARIEGQGRLGSQRAAAARGGLLGSDFAGAQKDRVQGFNEDIRRGISAERTAAIGNIMGNVRRAVVEEVEAKRAARQAGAEEYLNFITRKNERRESNAQRFAQDFIAQQQDPSNFDEAELNEMLAGSGVTPADLIRYYGQLTQEEGVDFGFMSTSGGIFRTDPSTGEATFIPGGGSRGSSGGASFTSTQRNKLEAAGLLDAPREDQLEHLFGEGADEQDVERINEFLMVNRNTNPAVLRRELMSEGMTATLADAYLETMPLSDYDISSLATDMVSQEMEAKFWKSRPTELEMAKSKAIEQLREEVQQGFVYNVYGRQKQLTSEEAAAIVQQIDALEGRGTANELLNKIKDERQTI